jgi:hypothetical protein
MPEYNQVIDLNEVVAQYEYEQTNMKVYIDADEVNSSNSIMDLSPNKTTLNVKNVSTTLLNGNLVFDSNSSPGIDCGFTPDLNKWTVEMYLKITKVRTDADHYYFTWGESSNRMAFGYKANTGFRLITVNSNHYFGSELNYDIPMNELFHIIVSHEDGYTTMFIDGNYVYGETTGSLKSNSGTLRVGEHYSKAEDYADMELRKFRFYDGRALTRYEMLKHYLITIEGDDNGVIAMADVGEVDEAIIEDEQATFLDENGNLNIKWKKGDIISSLRLNQMVGYINDHAVPGEKEDMTQNDILNNVLTLTKDKYQECEMLDGTEIVLPTLDTYEEIHLFFSTTDAVTIIMPDGLKYQQIPSILANKTYEFIFTYTNTSIGWIFGYIEYA